MTLCNRDLILRVKKIPSVNAMYLNRRSGGKRLSPDAQEFKADLLLKLSNSSLKKNLLINENRGYILHIVYVLQKKSFLRRDLDNLNKATIDSIFNYLGINDSRLIELHTYKKGSDTNEEFDFIKLRIEAGNPIKYYYVQDT